MTPHIQAVKGEIAKLVLMPGDPLRAKFIAETFLADIKIVSSVRNMLMYTGNYKGKRISICASGMGQPSIGIYAYELFKFYDVETIVRVGTAGAYDEKLALYDVFLVTSAFSDSSAFNKLTTGMATHVTLPSPNIVTQLKAIAHEQNVILHEGRVHSSDVFYAKRPLVETLRITKARCVEMESAALFAVAHELQKQAACLLTISDHLITHQSTSPHERQTAFTAMMKVALALSQ